MQRSPIERQKDLWVIIFSLQGNAPAETLEYFTAEDFVYLFNNWESFIKNQTQTYSRSPKDEESDFVKNAKQFFGRNLPETKDDLQIALLNKLELFQKQDSTRANLAQQLIQKINESHQINIEITRSIKEKNEPQENARKEEPKLATSVWATAWTKTFPFTGYDPVTGKHYLKDLKDIDQKTIDDYANSPIVRISSFFGFSNRMRRNQDEPEPSARDIFIRQFFGLPEHEMTGMRERIWHTAKAITYAILKPIFIIIPTTVINIVKLLTELPLTAASDYCDKKRKAAKEGSVAKGLATTGYIASTLALYLTRAITSPAKNIRSAYKAGKDFMSTDSRQQTDVDKIRRAREGKVLGSVLAVSCFVLTVIAAAVGIHFIALYAPGVIAKGISTAVNAIGNPLHHALKLFSLANLSVESLGISVLTAGVVTVGLAVSKTIDKGIAWWKKKMFGKDRVQSNIPILGAPRVEEAVKELRKEKAGSSVLILKESKALPKSAPSSFVSLPKIESTSFPAPDTGAAENPSALFHNNNGDDAKDALKKALFGYFTNTKLGRIKIDEAIVIISTQKNEVFNKVEFVSLELALKVRGYAVALNVSNTIIGITSETGNLADLTKAITQITDKKESPSPSPSSEHK